MMLKGQFTRWNETNTAELRRMWDEEGLSSGDIAFIMGITRNAVIGRVRRLGLQMRDNKVQPRFRPRKERAPETIKRRPRPLLPISLPGDTRFMRGDAWAPLPGSSPVPLIDLEPGMCKWPVSEDRPHLFCGAAAHGPYCEYHHALSVGVGTPSEREAHKWKEAA
jgi:GcrA cell cycle regulator